MFIVNPFVFSQSAFDADAQAFITAASITDSTQQSAVNQLVLDLKSYSLWSKMLGIYPMVGGSASSHKWNLKDPRDLDAAYRLSFGGGWTHGSTGAAPNGTNAYGSTFWAMDDISLATRVNNFHMSYYSRTEIPTGNGWVMGRGQTATGDPLYGIALKRTGTNARIFDSGNLSVNGRVSDTITDGRGFYIGARSSTTSAKLYKDGSTALNNTATVTHNTSYIGYGVALGALWSATPYYQSNECAFSSFGESLSDTEASNLNTAVQAFNTTLSRNV